MTIRLFSDFNNLLKFSKLLFKNVNSVQINSSAFLFTEGAAKCDFTGIYGRNGTVTLMEPVTQNRRKSLGDFEGDPFEHDRYILEKVSKN